MLIDKYQVLGLSVLKILALKKKKKFYSLITLENITRYRIMRQVTTSQAQLVIQTVLKSLTVSDSNLLTDANKQTSHTKTCTPGGKPSKSDMSAFMSSVQ